VSFDEPLSGAARTMRWAVRDGARARVGRVEQVGWVATAAEVVRLVGGRLSGVRMGHDAPASRVTL
jgi:hypothetical protein